MLWLLIKIVVVLTGVYSSYLIGNAWVNLKAVLPQLARIFDLFSAYGAQLMMSLWGSIVILVILNGAVLMAQSINSEKT